MEIVNNIALITINETMLVQLASFLVFLLIINRVMFRPLRKTIRERELYIDSLEDGISGAEQDLADLHREMTESEAAVRQEALRMRDQLVAEGDQKADAIFGEAKRDIERRMTAAEEETAAQIAAARRSIQAESRVLAATIMERILDRRLTT